MTCTVHVDTSSLIVDGLDVTYMCNTFFMNWNTYLEVIWKSHTRLTSIPVMEYNSESILSII